MFSVEVDRLKTAFKSGKTIPIEWRKSQLRAFLRMMKENRDAFCQAVWEDLHKSPVECEMMEFAQVQNDVVHTLEQIDERANVQTCRKKSPIGILDKAAVIKEPFGVVLIFGAWNYPIILNLQPMIGAISAGNCVLLKPSELAVATGKLLLELIPKYLDDDCFSVMVCGPKESAILVNDHRFDLIFYTGGSGVARSIMQAATKNLTPVVLECGGKNPCYVDKSCDVDSTAARLAWGKWTNCGQICLSPDFVLCEESVKKPLVEELKKAIQRYYGEDPKNCASYGRIVNERHVKRLQNLLEGVDVVHGGVVDVTEKYFSPTIVTNVREDAPIRVEEIFGPILPIFIIKDLDDALEFMNSGEKSLSLSVFTQNRSVIDRVVAETSSGGITVNELLMQHNELNLPFGGVGGSGIGYYHGIYSYDTYSHKRSYYESHTPELLTKRRYPPYGDKHTMMIRLIPILNAIKQMPSSVRSLLRLITLIVIGVLFAYFFQVLMP